MTGKVITQALVMAAGYAKRMRPLTDNLPKPLVKLGGKPLLSYIIEQLISSGVNHIVINGHHAIDELETYIKQSQKTYPNINIILSKEDEILETGGGAVKALEHLNPIKPFYMINGDSFWVNDTHENTLDNLNDVWNTLEKKADILLLLQRTTDMRKTDSVGDYDIQNNLAVRSHNKTGTYMFTGVRIVNPFILKNREIKEFSFLEAMDEAEKENRLCGYQHKGDWYHLSTPEDLINVNKLIFSEGS